uniref:Uncharacterized protein n=1 Tax=Ditylenchus dipsaci TaxID=166011 RepID=A0A915E560_9BILA
MMVLKCSQRELSKCGTLSCTSDIWTNQSSGFISLTAHGINEYCRENMFVLCVQESLEQCHTAAESMKRYHRLLNIGLSKERDSLFQDVDTRWNSTLLMCRQLCEQRRAVENSASVTSESWVSMKTNGFFLKICSSALSDQWAVAQQRMEKAIDEKFLRLEYNRQRGATRKDVASSFFDSLVSTMQASPRDHRLNYNWRSTLMSWKNVNSLMSIVWNIGRVNQPSEFTRESMRITSHHAVDEYTVNSGYNNDYAGGPHISKQNLLNNSYNNYNEKSVVAENALPEAKDLQFQLKLAGGEKYQTGLAETVSKVVENCTHDLTRRASDLASNLFQQTGFMEQKDIDNINIDKDAVLHFGINSILKVVDLVKAREELQEQAYELIMAAVPQAQQFLAKRVQKIGEKVIENVMSHSRLGVNMAGARVKTLLNNLGLPQLVLDHAHKVLRRAPPKAGQALSMVFAGTKHMVNFFKDSLLGAFRKEEEMFSQVPDILCLAIPLPGSPGYQPGYHPLGLEPVHDYSIDEDQDIYVN